MRTDVPGFVDGALEARLPSGQRRLQADRPGAENRYPPGAHASDRNQPDQPA